MNKIQFLYRRYLTKPIDSQISEYLDWKESRAPTMVRIESPILHRFTRFARVRDVTEIEVADIQNFQKLMIAQYSTRYLEEAALRSIRGFLRYYHARGHPCPSGMAVGRSSYQQEVSLQKT